jgi:hypothetical protein
MTVDSPLPDHVVRGQPLKPSLINIDLSIVARDQVLDAFEYCLEGGIQF